MKPWRYLCSFKTAALRLTKAFLKKIIWILLCCWVFKSHTLKVQIRFIISVEPKSHKIRPKNITQSKNPENCFLLTVMSRVETTVKTAAGFSKTMLCMLFCISGCFTAAHILSLSVFCSCRSKGHIMAGSEVIFKPYNPTVKEQTLLRRTKPPPGISSTATQWSLASLRICPLSTSYSNNYSYIK